MHKIHMHKGIIGHPHSNTLCKNKMLQRNVWKYLYEFHKNIFLRVMENCIL